jgi:hypothetical protein
MALYKAKGKGQKINNKSPNLNYYFFINFTILIFIYKVN